MNLTDNALIKMTPDEIKTAIREYLHNKGYARVMENDIVFDLTTKYRGELFGYPKAYIDGCTVRI